MFVCEMRATLLHWLVLAEQGGYHQSESEIWRERDVESENCGWAKLWLHLTVSQCHVTFSCMFICLYTLRQYKMRHLASEMRQHGFACQFFLLLLSQPFNANTRTYIQTRTGDAVILFTHVYSYFIALCRQGHFQFRTRSRLCHRDELKCVNSHCFCYCTCRAAGCGGAYFLMANNPPYYLWWTPHSHSFQISYSTSVVCSSVEDSHISNTALQEKVRISNSELHHMWCRWRKHHF